MATHSAPNPAARGPLDPNDGPLDADDLFIPAACLRLIASLSISRLDTDIYRQQLSTIERASDEKYTTVN